jgi:hypothetical protein
MALAMEKGETERAFDMKIYLATWLEDNQGVNLTEVGCRNRLLSYYFISQPQGGVSGQRKLKFNVRLYVKIGLAKLPKLEREEDEN